MEKDFASIKLHINARSVLRTVYTEESDTLFPRAIDKLINWVHYGIQAARFPMFGAKGEARKKMNPVYNDELWKRFDLDIVEDKFRLQSQDPTRDSARLSNYFREWVESKAEDPLDYRNPRFLDCIIINEDSMRSLLALPDETPPLRVPVDRREKTTWPADDDAFVWLLDSRAQSLSQNEDEYRQYGERKVVKLGMSDIRSAWFYRQGRSDRCEGLPYNGGDDWDAEYFLSM